MRDGSTTARPADDPLSPITREAPAGGDASRPVSSEHDELIRRVLYSLLAPAARISRRFAFSLRELNHWLEMAYFHELRKAGLTLKQIADRLEISLRKVSLLSSRLKENFFTPEKEFELPRRIEFLLWAEPMSALRIRQVLKAEHEVTEIDAAIALLAEQQRIELVSNGITEMYQLSKHSARLYQGQLMSRIDGLNHLLQVVGAAVQGRFFAADPRAFARSVSLRVAPEAQDELRALYQDVIWPKLAELEEKATGRPDAIAMDLSICWAPYDPTNEGD